MLLFVPEGNARGRGRRRRRFYDTLKMDLSERNIIVDARDQRQFWSKLTNMAEDRHAWQNVVKGRRWDGLQSLTPSGVT